ncbi:MAG: hypothetical protein QM811_02160 [Pirellulales bacterium]
MGPLLTALLLGLIALFLAKLGLLLEQQLSWVAVFLLIGGALGGAALGLKQLGRRVSIRHVLFGGIVLCAAAHFFAWNAACERLEARKTGFDSKKPLEAMFVAQLEPPTFAQFMTPPEQVRAETYAWWAFAAVAQAGIAVAVFRLFDTSVAGSKMPAETSISQVDETAEVDS